MRSDREGKSVTVDEAISHIPDRSRVYVAQGSGCPFGLLEEIDKRRDRFERLEFVLSLIHI